MGAAVLILCNKCDLNGAMSVNDITNVRVHCIDSLQYLEIKGPEFESRYWSVFSCSAMTGEGLKESFDWLVEHTYTGMAYMDEVDSQNSLFNFVEV